MKKEYIRLNFFLNYTKWSQIFYQFVSEHYEIFVNETQLEWDCTENYYIMIPKGEIRNLKKITFMLECLYNSFNHMGGGNGFWGFGIHGHSIDRFKTLVETYSRGSNYDIERYEQLNKDIIDEYQKICELCGEIKNFNEMPYFLEILPSCSEEHVKITDYINQYKTFQHNRYLSYPRKWEKEYFDKAIAAGNYTTKWASEFALFKNVRELYDDAIYQYRNNKILGNQSFDIYVPSKKIAFEYQGRQHYEPISFFGGEEGFEKRKCLDDRKRRICKERNIILIEWDYREIVTRENLKEKIEAAMQYSNN